MSEGDLSPQVNRALERIAQEFTQEVSNMTDLKTGEKLPQDHGKAVLHGPSMAEESKW